MLLHWVVQTFQMLTLEISLYNIKWHITTQYQKNYIHSYHHLSYFLKKEFKHWKARKLKVVETNFLLVFTRKLEFYHWQQIQSLVSLKWRAHFFHIWKNVRQNPNLNNYSLSVTIAVLSSKNDILYNMWLVQLATQIITQVFSGEYFMCTFHFSTQSKLKMCTHVPRFNTIIFSCSIRTFLSENDFLFVLLWVHVNKEHNNY